MKAWKIIPVCLLAGALLSCDFFLAPEKGRWNPADPKNTLVRVDKSIYPIVDGSIDENNVRDFTGPLLQVCSSMPMRETLLRFNPSDFPVAIDSVTLNVYSNSAIKSGDIMVYRIVQDWSPESVTWLQLISTSFVDYTVNSPLYVDVAPQYYSTDVTYLIKQSLEQGSHFGLLLRVSAATDFDLNSSRNANKPFLRVQGSDIP
jgi:hypothetical protein